MKMTIEKYSLKDRTGRHIRMATKVTLPDGRVIRFIDLMGKREAVKQVKYQLAAGRMWGAS